MATSTPMDLEFVTLDVFTDTKFLGNPLAVVFVPSELRSRLTQEKKQIIAREFNLSETVFLHMPWASASASFVDTHTTSLDVDIFTTEKELPFAGHPTIGTTYLVLEYQKWSHVTTLQTKAGPIPITPSGASIPHAVHVHSKPLAEAMRTEGSKVRPYLNDDESICRAECSARAVSIVRGMTFLLVELENLEALARAAEARRGLDFGKVKGLLDEGEWSSGFVARYYFVLASREPARREEKGKLVWKLRTRMAELACEDPATGSAACTLASYLVISRRITEPVVFEVTQGVEMGRRSEISVEVVPEVGEDGQVSIKDVHLGGTAVVVMKGSISV